MCFCAATKAANRHRPVRGGESAVGRLVIQAQSIPDRLKLDATFDTRIYSTDEHDLIVSALREIARLDEGL